MHFVRDDDNGLPVIAHTTQNGKQLRGLLRGQDGGRLVQDQYIGAAVEHLDDLDRLLFGNSHVIYLAVRLDIKAVFFGDPGDFLSLAFQIEARTLLFLDAENDVLRRRKHIDQLEVLMDHADPVPEGILRRTDLHLFAVHIHFPLVRVVDAGDHVHQRRLATAVFPEDRQDLSVPHLEIHIVVCHNAAEPLGHMTQFQCRSSCHTASS